MAQVVLTCPVTSTRAPPIRMRRPQAAELTATTGAILLSGRRPSLNRFALAWRDETGAGGLR